MDCCLYYLPDLGGKKVLSGARNIVGGAPAMLMLLLALARFSGSLPFLLREFTLMSLLESACFVNHLHMLQKL